MAYEVNKFNGTSLVSVADGTIDTTTDLRFVGKNYAETEKLCEGRPKEMYRDRIQ